MARAPLPRARASQLYRPVRKSFRLASEAAFPRFGDRADSGRKTASLSVRDYARPKARSAKNWLEKPVPNSERSRANHGLAIGSGAASDEPVDPRRLLDFQASVSLSKKFDDNDHAHKPEPVDVDTSNEQRQNLMSQLLCAPVAAAFATKRWRQYIPKYLRCVLRLRARAHACMRGLVASARRSRSAPLTHTRLRTRCNDARRATRRRAGTTMAAFQADDGYEEPHVIAEIGCNHMGQFEIAKELLTLAKNAGATVGKFQKRCPKELLTEEQYNAQHPNPHNSYGDTYGQHREFLELDVEQHRLLQKHCEEIGLLYSVFGLGHDVGERNRFLKPAVDQGRLAVEPALGDAESAQRRVQRHGPHLDGHDDEGRSGEDRELLGAG